MGLRLPSCLLLLLVMVPTLLDARCPIRDPCVLSCENCAAGDNVADPEDCTRYYRCQGSGPENYYPDPFNCGTNEVFDANQHECVPGTTCLYECPIVNFCSYECPATGLGNIPDETDCNTYYVCNGGSIQLTTTCSAEKPYFDGTKCQTDQRRCCHCHPYCDLEAAENAKRIADPLDCRRYYVCFDVGNPTDSVACEEGYFYDATIEECSNKVPCTLVAPCINVVGSDGCIDPFVCTDSGSFAKCPQQCTPEYYQCSSPTGSFQDVKTCNPGYVFNPDTNNCVLPDKCPYQ